MKRQTDSSNTESTGSSRREFLAHGGQVVAGAALTTAIARAAYAGEDNTIRLALIGCGGRGSGAVANALNTPNAGPVKLHAMADVFENRMALSHKSLKRRFGDKVDASDDRKFIGFDAYKKAIDCLRPGDVAMLTAYSYCRPTHLDYAVKKGVNVFMEKSFAPDPGGSHRMLQAGKEAEKKGLKIATGLMCRHSVNRQALIKKIRDGELGDLQLIRAFRMHGGRRLGKRKPEDNELQWQIRNKINFMWASSGVFIEYLIHQIDECCWLKDAWPVSAHGIGGRVPGSEDRGQNLDTYAIEYTFADGAKAMVDNRFMSKGHTGFATFAHGTKRAAQFSGNVHAGTVHTYKDQRQSKDNIDWSAPKERYSPWDAEWHVLLDRIRRNETHNETERAIYTNFVSIMGRAAVHYNNVVTWDQVFNSNFQFCDYVDTMNYNSPAPVKDDANGYYPVPVPGKWKET